jgi:hypothetical protein
MSDGPVLKPTIRWVSNDLLTREQPISAQKEEQQVIVDIIQRNVSFDTTSLVSMVPSSNKVSSSSRGFYMAKVTAHAGTIPVFL